MNKNWFDERETQVEPMNFTAFGIPCSSRYGKAYEIIDMMRFCEKCAIKRVNKYITELYYDSKACLCHIEYDYDYALENYSRDVIRKIADETLCQHDMDDLVGGYARYMERSENW